VMETGLAYQEELSRAGHFVHGAAL
jgi:hypothetical protein